MLCQHVHRCTCRLSTVRTADSIIVMEQGRVVEEGTHEDLVLEGGIYASLVARQTSTASKASSDPRLVSKGADSVADVHRALAKQVAALFPLLRLDTACAGCRRLRMEHHEPGDEAGSAALVSISGSAALIVHVLGGARAEQVCRILQNA